MWRQAQKGAGASSQLLLSRVPSYVVNQIVCYVRGQGEDGVVELFKVADFHLM